MFEHTYMIAPEAVEQPAKAVGLNKQVHRTLGAQL